VQVFIIRRQHHILLILIELIKLGDVCCISTALHGIQTRSSDENSVCPSVKRVECEKTEERYVQIFIPYERSLA